MYTNEEANEIQSLIAQYQQCVTEWCVAKETWDAFVATEQPRWDAAHAALKKAETHMEAAFKSITVRVLTLQANAFTRAANATTTPTRGSDE